MNYLKATSVGLLIGAVMSLIFGLTIAFIANNLNTNNGIIALDGYAHGVVVCGEIVTINEGHEKDPEVDQLLALAIDMCPNGAEDVVWSK